MGVSGGRDSVALLDGLVRLGFRRLVVVHLDHGLRGRASAADASFVRRLADRLGIEIFRAKADTRLYARERGVSIETAARELRLVCFAAAARRHRCRVVVLAHHAEDQVETCLFNFLRGSGARGLAGMRAESAITIGAAALTILRPMLAIRRAAIDAHIEAHRLRWREDASNRSAAHTRNRIRERVMPVLAEEFGPAFPDAVLRAARIFAAEDDWMGAEAARFPLAARLPVRELRDQPLALRRRIVRRWLEGSGLAEVGFAEVERTLSLLDAGSGPARVNLPGDAHARRRQGEIFLERT